MSFLFPTHEIFIFIGDSVAILCRGKEARRLTGAIILKMVWNGVHFKVQKILKNSLDLSNHLHLQWKFKLRTGKFAWGLKVKHCWALSTNFSSADLMQNIWCIFVVGWSFQYNCILYYRWYNLEPRGIQNILILFVARKNCDKVVSKFVVKVKVNE